jgi:uroporphyrinogen-III synthase
MALTLKNISVGLTRATDTADNELGQLLCQKGAQIQVMPLTFVQPIDAPLIKPTPLILLDACIFVSPISVQYGLDWLKQQPISPPKTCQFFAVGPATAKALHQAQKQANCPDQIGIDHLAEMPFFKEKTKSILVFRSPQGRESWIATLKSKGHLLTCLNIYQHLSLSWSDAEIQERDQTSSCLLIYSTQALKSLEDKAKILPSWLDKPLILFSTRQEEAARLLGFKQVFISPSMSHTDVLQTLEKLSPQLTRQPPPYFNPLS